MNMTFGESQQVRQLMQLHLPRYEELPELELYMDQVISVINEILQPLYPWSTGPILTATMINNYVKQKLVEPPVKKKYSRAHLACFIVVAVLKPVFSISQISALLQRQGEVTGTDRAYDRFCRELEQALQTMFGGGPLLESQLEMAGEADLLRAAVYSVVNQIYVEAFLETAGARETE